LARGFFYARFFMKQTPITPAAARSAVRDSAFRLSVWHAGRGV
jgi:hypothetical protein